jgi:hypothetical protein
LDDGVIRENAQLLVELSLLPELGPETDVVGYAFIAHHYMSMSQKSKGGWRGQEQLLKNDWKFM